MHGYPTFHPSARLLGAALKKKNKHKIKRLASTMVKLLGTGRNGLTPRAKCTEELLTPFSRVKPIHRGQGGLDVVRWLLWLRCQFVRTIVTLMFVHECLSI